VAARNKNPGSGPVIHLRGMAFDHPRGFAPMKAATEKFQLSNPSARISWDARSLKDFEDYPIENLAERYDLIMMDHPFIGSCVKSKALVPLDEHVSAEYLNDQERHSVGPSYQSYSWEGHQWALAVDAAAQVSAYRPDLLEARNLRVPETWDEMFELVEALPEETKIGLTLNPTHSFCTFITLCANINENEALKEATGVDLSVGEEALNFLRRLVPVIHEVSLRADPIQMSELMSRSNEVAYVPFMFGYSNYARPGFAPHIIHYTDIPSTRSEPSGSVLGGVGLAVSAYSEHRQVAIDFALFVAAQECQRGIYFESGGQPGHRAAWTDPTVNQRASGFFEDTLRTLDLAYLRPRHVGYPAFQGRAGESIGGFLWNGGNAREVIKTINRLYKETKTTGHGPAV
jgi:multiple sugar transport system substrate-binding protein